MSSGATQITPYFRPGIRAMVVSAPLLVGSVLGSCSLSHETTFRDGQERPAIDTPEHFLISTTDGSDDCRSPIVDARYGTIGILVRSIPGRGDYAFAVDRYEIRSGELLRVDCRSGRPIGIVRR